MCQLFSQIFECTHVGCKNVKNGIMAGFCGLTLVYAYRLVHHSLLLPYLLWRLMSGNVSGRMLKSILSICWMMEDFDIDLGVGWNCL